MGNLALGAIMVLFVIIITAMVAFLQTDANPSADAIGCDSNGNATTCDGGSPQSFLDAFFDVSISGFDCNGGTICAFFSGIYLLIMVGVLVIGFALIVAGIAGVPFGGG